MRIAWLLILALALFQPSLFATETSAPTGRIANSPTPEEVQEAERLAREHFGNTVVDGIKVLRSGADHSLAERSTRGNSITEAVTQLTGTAINPLFGVTVLGMYHYFSTPEHLRDQLPFYDQPHVWGGMLLIILLMFFNCTICEAIPFLKIPLNALGDLVNKGGACVVLPVVLHQFAQHLPLRQRMC